MAVLLQDGLDAIKNNDNDPLIKDQTLVCLTILVNWLSSENSKDKLAKT